MNPTQVGRMGGKCFSPLSRPARHGGCFSYGILFSGQENLKRGVLDHLKISAVTTITNCIGTY